MMMDKFEAVAGNDAFEKRYNKRRRRRYNSFIDDEAKRSSKQRCEREEQAADKDLLLEAANIDKVTIKASSRDSTVRKRAIGVLNSYIKDNNYRRSQRRCASKRRKVDSSSGYSFDSTDEDEIDNDKQAESDDDNNDDDDDDYDDKDEVDLDDDIDREENELEGSSDDDDSFSAPPVSIAKRRKIILDDDDDSGDEQLLDNVSDEAPNDDKHEHDDLQRLSHPVLHPYSNVHVSQQQQISQESPVLYTMHPMPYYHQMTVNSHQLFHHASQAPPLFYQQSPPCLDTNPVQSFVPGMVSNDMNVNHHKWVSMFHLLVVKVKSNGGSFSNKDIGFKLHDWLSEQRRQRRNSNLPEWKCHYLNNLGNW